MRKKYIYIVGEQLGNPMEYIDAVFDTKLKALAYLDRYKNKEGDLYKCEMNPEYHTDKTSNCYYLEFTKDGIEPESVMISNRMDSAKAAINDVLEFNLHADLTETIDIYLFATSEEEAIELGRARRDKAIEEGDW